MLSTLLVEETGGSEGEGAASGHSQQNVTLKAHTGRVTTLLHPHTHNDSLSEHLLVSGSADYSVRLWDMQKGTLLHTYSHHSGEVSIVLPCVANV